MPHTRNMEGKTKMRVVNYNANELKEALFDLLVEVHQHIPEDVKCSKLQDAVKAAQKALRSVK